MPRKTSSMMYLFHRIRVFRPQDQPPKTGPRKMLVRYRTSLNFSLSRPIVTCIDIEFSWIYVLISASVVPKCWIWSFMMVTIHWDSASLWFFSHPGYYKCSLQNFLIEIFSTLVDRNVHMSHATLGSSPGCDPMDYLLTCWSLKFSTTTNFLSVS